ncbi:MAG TPA: hypothetical protein VHG09_11110 [Longimicrobiales bacterium]|nr:hypothetical protein [Longimicrobiales bacterium]
MPLEDGGVLIVDALEPFIHVYDPQSKLIRTAGRKGEGPGELLSPAAVAVRGDTLSIFDRHLSSVVRWSLEQLAESSRARAPANMVALSTGCSGQLVGTYQVVTSESAGSFQPSGVGFYRHGNAGWTESTGRTVNRSPMIVSWTDMRLATSDSALAVFDWTRGYLHTQHCSGQMSDSVAVFVPEEWSGAKPHGIAWSGGDLLLLYSDPPDRTSDTTYLARWNRDTDQVVTRRIPGQLRLLAIETGQVWLVDARLAPELFTVSEEMFRKWASL